MLESRKGITVLVGRSSLVYRWEINGNIRFRGCFGYSCLKRLLEEPENENKRDLLLFRMSFDIRDVFLVVSFGSVVRGCVRSKSKRSIG